MVQQGAPQAHRAWLLHRQQGCIGEHAAQVLGQVRHGGIAVLHAGHGGLLDDRHQARRELMSEAVRGARHQGVARLAPGHRVVGGAAGNTQRDGLVQGEAHGELIGCAREGGVLGARLLGRHIRRRADHLTRPRVVGLDAPLGREVDHHLHAGIVLHTGQAPVHEEHLAVLGEHDVGRLHVAVDHAALVRVRQRLAHLDQRLDARREGVRTVVSGVLLGFTRADPQIVVVRLTLDQLHRQRRAIERVALQRVQRQDVRVLELAGQLGLEQEARHQRRGVGQALVHDLHRDGAAQVLVDAEAHGAHAAAAQLLGEVEATLERAVAP